MKRFLVKDSQGRTTDITGFEPSDFAEESAPSSPVLTGADGKIHPSFLRFFDEVGTISYLDSGLRTERISTVVYSSSSHPGAEITATVYYLDVGTINQRIDRIEYVGNVFGSATFVKTFNYNLVGIKYQRIGFSYELT